MPTVTRTPAAKGDLLEIWHHIAKDNLEAADRFLDTINEKCRLLAEGPEMGPRRSDLAPDVRSFAVRDYLIYYRPIQSGIEVLRVIHGSRDIPAVFGRPKP